MSKFRISAISRSHWLSLACAAAICLLAVQLIGGRSAPPETTAAKEAEPMVPVYHEEDLNAVEDSLETVQG